MKLSFISIVMIAIAVLVCLVINRPSEAVADENADNLVEICKAQPRTARAYEMGVRSGESMIRQFAKAGDRTKINRVLLSNIKRLTLNQNASDYVKCRYQGIVDGLTKGLKGADAPEDDEQIQCTPEEICQEGDGDENDD